MRSPATSQSSAPVPASAAMAERLALLSFVGGEGGYCAMAAGPEGSSVVLLAGDEPVRGSSPEPIGEGRAALEGPAGELEISWTPAGPMLEFAIDEGVRVHGVAASTSGPHGPLSGPGVLWDLPADGHSAIRTAWAVTAKSALTLLVAMRPQDSREHGEEIVGSARVLPGAEPYGYAEPLLSTEYDARGAHTRATLELWPSDDEGAPERGGGVRVAGSAIDLGAGRLEAARFAWSLDGSAAIGGYEILLP